jgi:hypothetical protein
LEFSGPEKDARGEFFAKPARRSLVTDFSLFEEVAEAKYSRVLKFQVFSK